MHDNGTSIVTYKPIRFTTVFKNKYMGICIDIRNVHSDWSVDRIFSEMIYCAHKGVLNISMTYGSYNEEGELISESTLPIYSIKGGKFAQIDVNFLSRLTVSDMYRICPKYMTEFHKTNLNPAAKTHADLVATDNQCSVMKDEHRGDGPKLYIPIDRRETIKL
jgi:hypothetical protein